MRGDVRSTEPALNLQGRGRAPAALYVTVKVTIHYVLVLLRCRLCLCYWICAAALTAERKIK